MKVFFKREAGEWCAGVGMAGEWGKGVAEAQATTTVEISNRDIVTKFSKLVKSPSTSTAQELSAHNTEFISLRYLQNLDSSPESTS